MKVSITADVHGISISEESERSQIMIDAFVDGSIFTGFKCGGFASVHRRDDHYPYWCST